MAWTGRLLMESKDFEHSRVVTLTYARDEDRFGDLNYAHIQNFLKIHRNEVSRDCRYFVCGEFGADSGHAHWHMVLFGEKSWQPPNMKEAVYCNLTGWTDVHGFASCMNLVPATAAYTCGYTLKKGKNLTPFTRHSLKPSIGFTRLDMLAETTFQQHGSKLIPAPSWWAFNGKNYPLNDGASLRFRRSYLALGGRLWNKPHWMSALERDAYLRSEEYLSEHTFKRLKRDEVERLDGSTVKEKEQVANKGAARI